MLDNAPVIFGEDEISIEDVFAISQRKRTAFLSETPAFVDKIKKGADFLDNKLQEDGVIYGVTTGYGDSVTRGVAVENAYELPIHLSRFHGCGLGKILSADQTRAVLAVRLASLCRGVSGVSFDLLRLLTTLLNEDILPIIPEEGSVGASGDLTPLSYVAAVLIGEREVLYKDERRPTMDVFKELNVTPLVMRPKEALAIMNGTAVMTGLACLAYIQADYLCQLTARLTAMTSLAMKGNPQHFDEVLFAAKPHPGQNRIAAYIREDIANCMEDVPLDRLQDRYSIRCAPHVIGVLEDMLPTFRQFIETELNSANDNPIIDGEAERILHGGHFYGGHIGFVMDGMKNLIANIADLVDRQMALLVDVKFNNGLPSNLSGAIGERAPLNHGLKAVQIGVSAWTAEALKNTMPASVFSRSTECHNQDKVSMGTIAARDCLRVIELTEQVIAGHLIACCQALRLRERNQELDMSRMTIAIQNFQTQLKDRIDFITEDKPLEAVLRGLLVDIRKRHWQLYK
ncbi:HAL/PAL/TAL family ammonia-lyase [Curvivirga aplysinae]|uniref:HAL/PAL/TAL family ammonia-lyase n=1 Tax=Curvivirga aplysinae TaxID=2529852 RepID=UPI001F285A1A|nr:aromatic amino acid ammonia-lyase [Curvivirga aplysinae]